MGTIITIIYT